MTTLAHKFLTEWAEQYEESEGEVSQPKFANSCEYSDVKNIPFQRFEDGSIVIAYRDFRGAEMYEHLDSEEVLDDEWDMEWSVNNNDYVMQNVWRV